MWKIALSGGHPCLRLYLSRYRADLGLAPLRNVRRQAHHKKRTTDMICCPLFMPLAGLEPARGEPLDFESSASANSATAAYHPVSREKPDVIISSLKNNCNTQIIRSGTSHNPVPRDHPERYCIHYQTPSSHVL